MVQAFSEEAKALTDADIVCGNTDVKKTVEYAERFLKDGERIFEVSEHKKPSALTRLCFQTLRSARGRI